MSNLRPLPLTVLGSLALGALALAASRTLDDGQGSARPGSRTDGLSAGAHVFGPPFDASLALGKIVVVEIGGS